MPQITCNFIILALALMSVGAGFMVMCSILLSYYRNWTFRRAQSIFRECRERLEMKHLALGISSTENHPLRWQDALFFNEITFLRSRYRGEVTALVPVRLTLEECSHYETCGSRTCECDGTAFFTFSHGSWDTSGKTLFNLPPRGYVDYFRQEIIRQEIMVDHEMKTVNL